MATRCFVDQSTMLVCLALALLPGAGMCAEYSKKALGEANALRTIAGAKYQRESILHSRSTDYFGIMSVDRKRLVIASGVFHAVGGEVGVADNVGSARLPLMAQAAVQGGSGLAAEPAGRKAGAATCTPSGSKICKGFEGGCDSVGGGLSSSPDGGVTCSVAKTKARGFARRLRADAQRLDAVSGSDLSEVSTCRSDGSDDGDQICRGFAQACEKVGCGPSTEPDGGAACAC